MPDAYLYVIATLNFRVAFSLCIFYLFIDTNLVLFVFYYLFIDFNVFT